jgi:two-component system phosphate regulon response regulator PhoB
MGGLDLCRLMREDPGLKKVPIIVITGSGVDYVKSQCKAAGADECITKPYRVKALLATIVDLLGK